MEGQGGGKGHRPKRRPTEGGMLFGGNPGATGEERGERSSGGVWEAPAGQALSHPSTQALCSGPSASRPQRSSSQFLRPHQIFTLRLPQGIFWKTHSPPTPTSKEKARPLKLVASVASLKWLLESWSGGNKAQKRTLLQDPSELQTCP